MTDEEIAALKAENDALKAQAQVAAKSVEDVSKTVAQLQKENQERAEREKSMNLEMARRDTILKYPTLKGFEDMVAGTTKEEIETKAKAMSDKIEAREKEIKDKIPAAAWAGIPHSVPSSIAITKDRQDEYASVRADKSMNKTQKLATMMGMKIHDLFTRKLAHDKQRLGIG